MSKDLADHYLTWLRTSPYGKKYGSDLPLDAVIKASFDATPKNEVDKENGLKKAALKEAKDPDIQELVLWYKGIR